MKKLILTTTAIALFGASLVAQNNRKVAGKVVTPSQTSTAPTKYVRCATPAPSAEWEKWFDGEVEKFKEKLATGKATVTGYTIPVIIHVIHSGQAVGTFPNLAQAQLNSQITVLNQDYSGTGFNHTNVPGVFSSLVANTGVQFCLVTKDPNGITLAEPGIDRINYTTKGWSDPASFTSIGTFMSYMDGTIKPGSIWDPSKYMNMWVTDVNGSTGLLGYATFPIGTSLAGVSGNGSATTDGFWAWAKSFGSVNIYAGGTYAAPYNMGRTCTHEIGHYLGLRHIWGDGTCATDYCNDTPPANTSNGGCPAFPHNVGVCAGNTTGEMTMNFMDYTDDNCMYMFTPDQTTRIQTAMQQGTYRQPLTGNALTECAGLSASTPVAAFTFPGQICTSTAAVFTDGSSGPPTSWSWSVTPSAGVTITTSASQNPNITFTNPGTYSVSLTATNSQGSGSITNTVSVSSCTVAVTCPDTLTNFKNTDSITIFKSTTGYVSGNNNYGDLEKGEFYPGTGLPVNPKVTGGIILFYRNAASNQGTKGTATININMYNGVTSTTGPSTAAVATNTVSLSTITALTPVMGVPYCGNPALSYTTALIYPYDFNFAAPVPIIGGFMMSVTLPPNGTDTAAVFMTSGKTASASTAWEKQTSGTWFRFNDGTTNSWQLNSSLAILPKISCGNGIPMNSISNHLAMFPNPSNGNINFATTMPQPTNLTFNVVNTLGQVVYSKVEKGVTNNIINIDLTDKAKGVYYINISSDDATVVLKAIVR